MTGEKADVIYGPTELLALNKNEFCALFISGHKSLKPCEYVVL